MKTKLSERILNTFSCRRDVYALGWEAEDGNKGFSPVCDDRGESGLCDGKCEVCENGSYRHLTQRVVRKHLAGRTLVGIYPLFPDNTTKLLVAELFDPHEPGLKLDRFIIAKKFRLEAKKLGLKCYIQKSELEQDYRVWFFFRSPVPSFKAIKLGKIIMNLCYGKTDKRYPIVRFFPSKTKLTGKKLDDVIRLPFYGNGKGEENGLFLNPQEVFRPYRTIEDFLDRIYHCESAFVEKIVSEAGWILRQKESD